MVAPHSPRTGDLAHNPGICPDWELNWRPFGSQACTQSPELHQPGLKFIDFRERETLMYCSIYSWIRWFTLVCAMSTLISFYSHYWLINYNPYLCYFGGCFSFLYTSLIYCSISLSDIIRIYT